MKKIKRIVEAYSMQPAMLEIESESAYKKQAEWDKSHPQNSVKFSKRMCKEMKEEAREIDNIKYTYIVGYNFDDSIIFEYLKNSVNIYYEI